MLSLRSMSLVGSGGRRARQTGGWLPVALLPPAAFAVHQLRYMVAYGSHAGAELERTGHSYLHSVVPWLVALLALTAGWFLRSLGRAFRGQRSPHRYAVSLGALWLACTAALVAIYGTQEFLEGFFATGHPAGIAGVFGYGGWWAVFVAACIGLVLAAVCHGARWVIGEVARRRASAPIPARRSDRPRRLPAAAPLPRLLPLAEGWSGRGPPR